MNLEKVHDRDNREALQQGLKTYNEGGKLVNEIKTIYVKSLAWIRTKGIESKLYGIDSSVWQRFIICPIGFSM